MIIGLRLVRRGPSTSRRERIDCTGVQGSSFCPMVVLCRPYRSPSWRIGTTPEGESRDCSLVPVYSSRGRSLAGPVRRSVDEGGFGSATSTPQIENVGILMSLPTVETGLLVVALASACLPFRELGRHGSLTQPSIIFLDEIRSSGAERIIVEEAQGADDGRITPSGRSQPHGGPPSIWVWLPLYSNIHLNCRYKALFTESEWTINSKEYCCCC